MFLCALEFRVNYFSRVASVGGRPSVALRGRVRRNSARYETRLYRVGEERFGALNLPCWHGHATAYNARFVRFTKSVSVARHATCSKVSIG